MNGKKAQHVTVHGMLLSSIWDMIIIRSWGSLYHSFNLCFMLLSFLVTGENMQESQLPFALRHHLKIEACRVS